MSGQLHGRQLHDLDVKYGTAGQRGYQRRRRRGRDGDGRHDGSDVRLEDVGPHPGHVAHVVAHEIGERRGVSRIVLGNAGLHLADEIGAHVGRFGIDSAAHACKEGNRTGAHREPVDDHRLFRVTVQKEQHAHTQQAQAGHGEAHHRTAGKRHAQGGCLALLIGGIRGAHVGLGGCFHPEKTGAYRTDCAGQKGEGRAEGPDADRKQDEYRHDEDRKHEVFALQKRHGAFVDGIRNLPHPVRTGRFTGNQDVHQAGDQQPGDPKYWRPEHKKTSKNRGDVRR